MQITFDIYQTVAVAAGVYYLGKLIRKKVSLFSHYCIPAPVIGGLIFAILALVLRLTGVLTIEMDITLQSVFMSVFFTSIGFTACFRLIKKGGVQVFLFLGLIVGLVIMQNILGSVLAVTFGMNPLLGLCTASIPMVGGHGTAGSFGPLLAEMGVTGAATVAIACATYGLISGSIIGGPIANRLIEKNKLEPTMEDVVTYAEQEQDAPKVRHVEIYHFMDATALLFVAMGIGSIIFNLLKPTGFTFPSYIGSMLAAAVIRNVCDAKHKELPEREIDVCGNVSLAMFLSMALMSLKLWELAGLAMPLIIMLLAQTLLMALYARFVIFKAMGNDYEGAVMTTAACGFGMGATPNAMANMDAVTSRYGPAPKAFFIVPLVGSLFIDFFNGVILTIFINVLPAIQNLLG